MKRVENLVNLISSSLNFQVNRNNKTKILHHCGINRVLWQSMIYTIYLVWEKYKRLLLEPILQCITNRCR